MSSIYVIEPPTKGKVVLETTMGPLDIELWPKEAPKAVRNFVQLCLEGYYDRTIFHRIIKSFLVQGGDPTGSGTGGESIYGGAFADEFHSRLRFNHRGLVACANAGSPHSNGSQFFMTLDRCDWLDRKNTIFGKVTGDSIYNLLRLGNAETNKDDKPLNSPPKILSVEVLWNPFEDIIPRQVPGKLHSHNKDDGKGKDQKQKAVKKLNVLSFGEEVEEEEKEVTNVEAKIKSIHDILDDPWFLKEEAQKDELSSAELEKRRDVQMSVREALSSKKAVSKDPESNLIGVDNSDDNEATFETRMRLQILKKHKEMGDLAREKTTTDRSNKKGRRVPSPRSNGEDSDGEASKVEKLAIKKKEIGSEARAERMAQTDSDLQLLNQAEQGRQIKKQTKRQLRGREDDTLAKLEKFKKSLLTKLSTPDIKDKDGDSGWTANQLTFIPDSSGKDGMTCKDDPNI